jgi:hypothetical protein
MIIRICSSDHLIFGRFFLLLFIAGGESLLLLFVGIAFVSCVRDADVFDVKEPGDQQSVVTVVQSVGVRIEVKKRDDPLALDGVDELVSQFVQLPVPHLFRARVRIEIAKPGVFHHPLDADLTHDIPSSKLLPAYTTTPTTAIIDAWCMWRPGGAKGPSEEGPVRLWVSR